MIYIHASTGHIAHEPREGYLPLHEAEKPTPGPGQIVVEDATVREPERFVRTWKMVDTPPPEQATKRQLLHWLEFDHAIADPEAAIVAAITEHVPEQMRAFALADWIRTYYIRRDNPLVPLLAAVLQIADVDAAFREMEEKYG